jgi:DNA mismatch endonuclease (patch repair protein)
MGDIVTPDVRSRMMTGIRGRDTKPELVVRRGLHAAGFRFRLHRGDLPGRPDIVLPKHQVVIFVHGCFWHRHEGCANFRLPMTNRKFWREKFARNVDRDTAAARELLNRGWRVLIVWECETRRSPAKNLVQEIVLWIAGNQNEGEITAPLIQHSLASSAG